MRQIFLSRDRAIELLMYRKRESGGEPMGKLPAESGAYSAAVMTDIQRLVLDVKAGRLHAFELAEPDGNILRVYVS
jgi:hypothetical protein